MGMAEGIEKIDPINEKPIKTNHLTVINLKEIIT